MQITPAQRAKAELLGVTVAAPAMLGYRCYVAKPGHILWNDNGDVALFGSVHDALLTAADPEKYKHKWSSS